MAGFWFGRPEKPLAPVPTVTHSRTGGRASSARQRGEFWHGVFNSAPFGRSLLFG